MVQATRPLEDMGYKPYIGTLNAEAIEGLVEENDLTAALNMLKEWAGSAHGEVRKEVIILKGRLAEINQKERLDLIPLEEVLRCKAKVSYAILSLLGDITS
jgi:hypothetical protein